MCPRLACARAEKKREKPDPRAREFEIQIKSKFAGALIMTRALLGCCRVAAGARPRDQESESGLGERTAAIKIVFRKLPPRHATPPRPGHCPLTSGGSASKGGARPLLSHYRRPASLLAGKKSSTMSSLLSPCSPLPPPLPFPSLFSARPSLCRLSSLAFKFPLSLPPTPFLSFRKKVPRFFYLPPYLPFAIRRSIDAG